MNRINSGDMPPEDEKRPKPEDIAKVSEWIAAQLHEGEALRQSGGGEKVTFHKLTREEYANAVRDLLGVNFDVKGPWGLPEDPDWHGFERIGSVLTLSPAHVEKHLAAAEAVLDEALSIRPQPKRETITWTPWDLRWKSSKGIRGTRHRRSGADRDRAEQLHHRLMEPGGEDDGRVCAAPEGQRPAARGRSCAKAEGLYVQHRQNAHRAGHRHRGGQAGHRRGTCASHRGQVLHPPYQQRARPKPRGPSLTPQRHTECVHQRA